MHHRRRVWSAGAVVFATAGIVLSASPAQAGCASAPERTQPTEWQVGMQLGPAPVALHGAGELPAALLEAVPVSEVAVEDARGQNLLRVNASSRLAEAQRPAFSDDLSQDLPDALDLAAPVASADDVRTGATKAVRAPAPQVTHVVEPVAQPVDRAGSEAVAAPIEVPLQVPGADSVLGGQYAWVPIEGIGSLGPDSGGLPWASGLALAVLAGGTGAVTVVARHRRTAAR